MENNYIFTINELSAKWKSKTEVYNLLSREGDIYLPPKQDAISKYLRDLMMGKKLHLKCSEVNVIKVPQYKDFKVRDLIRFAESKLDIDKYLPEYSYHKEPNREWLCNIISTLVKDEFKEFIREKIDQRNKELINMQNLGICAKQEFIDIFKRSQAIPTIKGKSHFLTRVPKLTKDQQRLKKLEDEKNIAESKTKLLKRELDGLRDKITYIESIQGDADENIEKLGKLYKMGIIDENGEPINNNMN